VSTLAFSPDGTVLAGGDGMHVGLWSVGAYQLLAESPDYLSFFNPRPLAFSPDGRYLTAGGILLRSADASKVDVPFPGMLAFAPDGAHVAVLQGLVALTMLEIQNDTFTTLGSWTLPGPADRVAYAPDGNSLAFSSSTNPTLYTVPTSAPTTATWMRGTRGTGAVATAADAAADPILTFDKGGNIRLFDAEDVLLLEVPTGLDFTYLGGWALSPARDLIALTDDAGQSIQVWDLAANRQRVAVPNPHDGDYLDSVQFTADGQHILTAGQDMTARLWRVSDGSLETVMSTPGDSYIYANQGPDSGTVMVGGVELYVFDAQTGFMTKRFPAGNMGWSISTPADRSLVNVTSTNGWMWIYRTSDWAFLAAIHAHTADTQAMFSPDGSLIVSTGPEDGILRVWRTADMSLVGALQPDGLVGLEAVVKGADGKNVAVTGSGDDILDVWCLPPAM
jgi:WD40 repeat protein